MYDKFNLEPSTNRSKLLAVATPVEQISTQSITFIWGKIMDSWCERYWRKVNQLRKPTMAHRTQQEHLLFHPEQLSQRSQG